ncbi:glycosyltransferase family 2 protein [Alcanivorax sp. JB21]|uniref:glycosyltransferase family 2 protein n=1 Tax=Alcanivorax limicola TaxID=2874102 RepID=UPI001CBCA109|nr:glycosyltransferase family 2 protein [Alcanivorax limicola]MBZ2190299.1 glycosyltransferase family 2 protein [Alcanivorax limicola]
MIVIPMVGLSSRFFKEGYTRPKYQLNLGGISVFEHAIRSFSAYFHEERFRFLVRSDYGAADFVREVLGRLNVRHVEVHEFDQDTRGQAETVYLGLRDVSEDESLYIFNIDTFRPGFSKPCMESVCDGYLEVFCGEGEHWSFVLPGKEARVIRTTEKERISDLCSDGLYYFRRKGDFDAVFREALSDGDTVRNEYYIAPLYNRLIRDGKDIRYHLIDGDDVIFCGTPAEYESLQVRWGAGQVWPRYGFQ